MIQIRNVPEDIHRKLKSRAALAGLSLSDYILRDIRRSTAEPTMEEWLELVARLRPVKTRESSAAAIRAIRDSR
jgi:plasmid stability protein